MLSSDDDFTPIRTSFDSWFIVNPANVLSLLTT